MRAIVQDRFGSADVLELRDIDRRDLARRGTRPHLRRRASTAASGTSWPGSPTPSGSPATASAPLKKPVPGADVAGVVEYATGVCNTSKVDLVRSTGADEVIDYTRDDIGGNSSLSRLRSVLTPTGTLVIVGGEAPGRILDGNDRQAHALVLSRFVDHTLGTFVASVNAADLEFLTGHIETGVVAPVMDRSYPLTEAADAIRHVGQGPRQGPPGHLDRRRPRPRRGDPMTATVAAGQGTILSARGVVKSYRPASTRSSRFAAAISPCAPASS
jgi:hypothetical protein